MSRKEFVKILCCAALTGVLISGCGATEKGTGSTSAAAAGDNTAVNSREPVKAEETGTKSADAANETTAEKEKSTLVLNDTGKTVISKANTESMYNTTYMIISKAGTVVLIDPIQILDGIEADIIATTHGHSDHNDGSAVGKPDFKETKYKVESFTHKDVKVTGVAASHGDYTVNPDSPDDVIYIFEVDGLRIAHMGDIGQSRLTDEQMKAIGKLDAVFMPCIDLPQYGLTMENSLKLLEQLKPQIVIPTHFDASNYENVQKLKNSFDESLTEINSFVVSRDDLKDGKRKFIQLY